MIECVRNVKLGLSLCHKVRIATRSLVPASSLRLDRKCEGPSNSTAHAPPRLLLSPPVARALLCMSMSMEYPDVGQRTSSKPARR